VPPEQTFFRNPLKEIKGFKLGRVEIQGEDIELDCKIARGFNVKNV
jgi:hypothetical protein